MRACIFESSMSIFVNGSPTSDFKVGRGLRQSDPLSPSLFLIIAEGLAGLMRKVVEIGKFKGYRVNDDIQFQILQFADDTIFMGKGIWDNIWTIKIVLRSFELVSRLKINFVKSKLYGINVDSRLLEAGSSFLSCQSEVIPFKFLGIPVGANPRRRETWKSVVDAMSKRYDHLPFQLLDSNTVTTRANLLIWWKDVTGLSRGMEVDCFKLNVRNYVGSERFHGNGVIPLWSWQWNDRLTATAEQQLDDLKELLVGGQLWQQVVSALFRSQLRGHTVILPDL
ncbi:ribonuclease H [Trifolium pratense]|uniref:Ribonuclease H n=1 Tax=Trifolium pratense TaxID=57577 RepID=A0A2K3P4W0_TRIPR|nr:ribonuclease H [Trifolium pratense]